MTESKRSSHAPAPGSGVPRKKEGPMSNTPHKIHNPGFLALVADAKSQIEEMDIAQYQSLPRDGHVLIDVREDHEWAAGHAQGAIHLSKGVIERDIETLVPSKSTKMVLY